MKSKKQVHLWKSGIIQAIKWTTMSFACLMTFSLGIFLGKQWSETDPQSIHGTSIELGSKTKETLSEQKQPQDAPTEKSLHKKHALNKALQLQPTLLKETLLPTLKKLKTIKTQKK